MKNCDVIIPIFNAYEAVKECVKSVLKSTDFTQNNLILIDDKSTDERINDLLNVFKRENKNINIEVIENPKNLGFVKSANLGMRQSCNDVLLLNSDTEVSNGWLDKIIKCAYSNDDVATVTPLSNNATLVSVPNLLEANTYDIYNLEEYNTLLESISDCDYPELPTAHGFCMYIRRDALDEVGYFDEDLFGKGYGEENDFCYRCIDKGFRHLLCDNTIVYHKESQSFINTRSEVVDSHMDILRSKYEEHCNQTDYWLKLSPLTALSNKIKISLTTLNKKNNIMLVIHEMDTYKGGTTLHMMDLVDNLKYKYNFVILYYDENSTNYGLRLITDRSEYDITLKSIHSYSSFWFYNSDYKKMCNDIFNTFNISSLHIHHIKNHYFDIVDIAKDHNVKTIITLHDFFCLCPNTNLLEYDKKCCLFIDKPDCDGCLSNHNIFYNNIIDKWRYQFNIFLNKFDQIIVPSDNTKNIINKHYSNLHILSIPHGVSLSKSKYQPTFDYKIFNVASLGVMCLHKGSEVFKNLIFSGIKKVKFHGFGYSSENKLTKNRYNYIYHGKYNKKNIYNFIQNNNINLICFFQLWPETYSYTVDEAISTGVPVLIFDIGAGADRVKKYNLGWVIDVNSSTDEIKNKILKIMSNRDDYCDKLKSIKQYNFRSLKNMSIEYDELYDVEQAFKTDKPDCLEKWFFLNNFELQLLDDILNSRKWRLLDKVKTPMKIRLFLKKIIIRS